jgi:hypothetical protein
MERLVWAVLGLVALLLRRNRGRKRRDDLMLLMPASSRGISDGCRQRCRWECLGIGTSCGSAGVSVDVQVELDGPVSLLLP